MPYHYFISPLNLNKINNGLLNKLKERFNYKEIIEETLYTKNGYYTIKDGDIFLHKLIHNQSFKQDNYLNKYTIYGNDFYIKKIENITQLPSHFFKSTLTKLIFYEKLSNTSMIIELQNNIPVKLYFNSRLKDLRKTDFFFNNDISLYLKTLNI